MKTLPIKLYHLFITNLSFEKNQLNHNIKTLYVGIFFAIKLSINLLFIFIKKWGNYGCEIKNNSLHIRRCKR